jgi:hypothetical protein
MLSGTKSTMLSASESVPVKLTPAILRESARSKNGKNRPCPFDSDWLWILSDSESAGSKCSKYE